MAFASRNRLGKHELDSGVRFTANATKDGESITG